MKILRASCPMCDFSEVERIPRRFWMRMLPSLRHYYCGKCSSTLLARKDLVESRQWMQVAFRGFKAPPLPGGADQ
jgi:hypothetical protein